jgi:hypothetical protein
VRQPIQQWRVNDLDAAQSGRRMTTSSSAWLPTMKA